MQEQEPYNLSSSRLGHELEKPLFAEVPDRSQVKASDLGHFYKTREEFESKRKDVHVDWNRVLGKGGFGIVYQARINNESVAVKVCHILTSTSPGVSPHAIRAEVLNWRHVNGHPFVLKLMEALRVGPDFWFLTELSDVGDFLSFVQKNQIKRLDVNFARSLFGNVVNGVNYLHGRCIAHRDIKVGNILLFTDDSCIPFRITAKVADMGVSCVAWTTGSGIVYQNNACGTIRYWAPELLFSHYEKKLEDLPPHMRPLSQETEWTRPPPAVEQKKGSKNASQDLQHHRDYQEISLTNALSCDVYALGVTLFVMMTTHYPMRQADNPTQGLLFLMKGKMIKFRFMPQSSREFVRKLLDPNPVTRPTLRCVLNDDWFRKNPPSRAVRQACSRSARDMTSLWQRARESETETTSGGSSDSSSSMAPESKSMHYSF